MRTFEIIDIEVNHPEAGMLKKKAVIYYDGQGKEETREFYLDEDETPVRPGYKPKPAK